MLIELLSISHITIDPDAVGNLQALHNDRTATCACFDTCNGVIRSQWGDQFSVVCLGIEEAGAEGYCRLKKESSRFEYILQFELSILQIFLCIYDRLLSFIKAVLSILNLLLSID